MSAAMDGVEIIRLRRREDSRGWLLKILMRHQLGGSERFGEIYVTTARPGESKGGHFHELTTEWFALVRGSGVLTLEDKTTGERRTVELSEEEPVTVRVPPMVAHTVKNTGRGMLYLLAYSDRPYDPEATDTYAVEL
ncbi:MAG TPA: cupin domain-containing protein [Deltaproteobacteria bacterium]|nr:cupin domain-containing protein [Deltaproteobacteria bacterium]